ncbi:phosphoenolpyruvate carboxylase [Halapricum hydrolyticum]|uniref:Phosphoenolpyruvate carboxylase n=1 Tax=Halapricum hydrolyticum TaxID=2979991 RepID=A0AAE3LH07_9EURY|nr:phosphoenolpyruvate carboxylase [Halapricum hydrolyticum]MCU4718423.1 phosphoenolpyruvate carboxylase [Halapricum hydrolyticum]MCU4726464.1 phosphoenolpyruvate carboxylase [Halapricum hydrolyticum]
MPDPPRVLSTQHPDNATVPFFAEGDVIEGEDEIQEAYYAYSHLGADEQMWDFEGKEGDEYAVKKLLSRFDQYFLGSKLGEDVRLTVRGPNPDIEEAEAKILLEILESIPRSYDAAELFYDEHGERVVPPIFEVIIPMVTDADQLNAVHDYYEQFVVGKGDEYLLDDRTVSEWVGEFRPNSINVIPLIEEREHMLAADEIIRGYVEGRDIDAQRVFLARSDPALNYGSLSADLINKVTMQRLYDMAEEEGIEIYPMLGAGSAPFRGNLSPTTVEETLDAWPEVETFTVQSAFKYDYPIETVQGAIETLRSAPESQLEERIDEERALEVVDAVEEVYAEQVEQVAPLVNRIAEYTPKRRARKLHVGLFGYSREVGEMQLPRAITYTATLYSIGFPPTLMGLAGLSEEDIKFVEEAFPRFFETLEDAAQYYNPRSQLVLPLDEDRATAGLDLVDVDLDPRHRAATDDVIDALEREDGDAIRAGIVRAAQVRQFLG